MRIGQKLNATGTRSRRSSMFMLDRQACPSFVPFFACLLMIASATVAAEPSPVYLADGTTLAATGVTMIDGEHVLFATDTGEKAVALDQLVKWGALRDSSQGTQVLLADGSLLVVSDVRIADEQLVVESNLFGDVEGFKLHGTLELPLEAVKAVVLRVPIEPRERDRLLAKIRSATGNADQLLLANGDVLTGTLKKLEPAAGDDEQPGPLTATLATTAGEVTIAPDRREGRLADKIAAIVFNPQLVRAPARSPKLLAIGLADGSLLMATKVEGGDECATFTTAVATIKSHPDENIWSQITLVQSLAGSVKYLSELKGTGYKQVPLVGAPWPLGVDENVLGGRLRSSDRLYLRGLGMHAMSVVGFTLDRPYAKFQAELALDDSTGEKGSVHFLVLSDASGAFKPIYKSPLIRGGDAPTPIVLGIAGAKRLALIVEPADHGDVLDRANWLDARLLP